jgi:TolA-binding protein
MANDNFSLMGSPMFRMGMGILEGATPQATPPNAIRNMLGGLQGASDYRNTEVNRMLDRQRYKMQLEQQKREQEKWEFERKQLERQQKVMDQWPQRIRAPLADLNNLLPHQGSLNNLLPHKGSLNNLLPHKGSLNNLLPHQGSQDCLR